MLFLATYLHPRAERSVYEAMNDDFGFLVGVEVGFFDCSVALNLQLLSLYWIFAGVENKFGVYHLTW